MILLPDEDGMPVDAQVHAAIGDALRQSVADVEPSAGFGARLAAALDVAEAQMRRELAAGEGGPAGEVVGEVAGPGAPGTGQGAETADAAS
ncbi:hypothetical protein [Massilia eburnea]|uniref:hypothetical protein n=1 Tax=Massilia eburnea TaxID=1776165 RepID=UPI003D6B49C2